MVDASKHVSIDAPIALDRANCPHSGYHGAINGDLNYARAREGILLLPTSTPTATAASTRTSTTTPTTPLRPPPEPIATPTAPPRPIAP
ncbi:MAG: hypothetical protein ACK44M_04440 [Chloroflexus sp.]